MANGWFAWDEFGYVSTWSIMHFLSGYLWNIVWVFALSDYVPWLNLLLLSLFAVGFEILENQPGSGSWMWGCIGYDETTYTGDTAINSGSDIFFSLLGWGVVRLVAAFTTSSIALGVLLGVAGGLFIIFLVLFSIERRIQLGPKAPRASDTPSPVRPALLLASSA